MRSGLLRLAVTRGRAYRAWDDGLYRYVAVARIRGGRMVVTWSYSVGEDWIDFMRADEVREAMA